MIYIDSFGVRLAVLCLVAVYVHLVNYSSRFDLREKLVGKSGKKESKYTVYIFSVNCFEAFR